MLKILRRRKPVADVVDDTAARRILASPLSDAETVAAVFGSPDAALDVVNARYFELAVDRRPRLSIHVDPVWYAARNPDVVEAGMDPYLHFLTSGMGEGRDPHPLVDLAFVRARLDADAGWDDAALADVLRTGRVPPHPLFDPGYYLSNNDDVREAGIPALAHFLQSGAEEGRRPHPRFDADEYIATHPGAPTGRYEAFLDFVSRHAAPDPDAGGDAEPAADAGAADPVPAEPGIAADAEHYTGSFDAVEGGIAMGWAFDSRRPMERLVVEIVAGGVVVGRGRADVFREDLLEHGIGDGAHHFNIRLAQELADGERHEVSARIADAPASVLNGSHAYVASPGGRRFDMLPVAVSSQLAAELADAHGDRAGDYRQRVGEAGLQLVTGAVDEAVGLLRALDADYPGDPLVRLRLAEAALVQGRMEDAASAFAVAAQSAATAGWGLLGLGNTCRLQGDLDGAEHHLRQAQARASAPPPVAGRLAAVSRLLARRRAWTLIAAGDVDGALALLVPELAACPDDAELCEQVAGLLVPDADAAGLDPVLHRARRSLALLEAVMAHVRTRRGVA